MNKLLIYGDSLSTGTHGDGAYLADVCKALCIDELENYAVGSSGLSKGTPNSMIEILEKQKDTENGKDADIILVWHGTNDWYWGVPIGSLEERNPNCFLGAMQTAVNELRKKNPESLIVWCTPIFRLEAPDGSKETGNAFTALNKVGHNLYDYTAAIWKGCHMLGIPLIEMGQLAGIHEYNEHKYLEDHVHPNREGYEIISQILMKELKRYQCLRRGN